MARYPNLLVWSRSRELVRRVSRACVNTRGEGDLISQLRRAAISVAANVAAGIRDQAADVGRLIGGFIRRCAGGG